jgi:hypothetical protein
MKGFCSAISPAIHMRAGEKVCIQVTRPAQRGSLLACRHSARMPSLSVTVGLITSRAGSVPAALRPATICSALAATCCSVLGPYRCWLPTTNQVSSCG